MGQELIKRAVDAAVFLINLTSALIKFVITAGLVPVCHQTQKQGRRGKRRRRRRRRMSVAVNVRDSVSKPVLYWSTFAVIPVLDHSTQQRAESSLQGVADGSVLEAWLCSVILWLPSLLP